MKRELQNSLEMLKHKKGENGMPEEILFVATALASIVALALVALVYWRRREAIRSLEHVRWLEAQLERALLLINSGQEEEILVGLQTLAMLNDPRVRLSALGRINILAQSDNPRIAKNAKVVYGKILGGAAGRVATEEAMGVFPAMR